MKRAAKWLTGLIVLPILLLLGVAWGLHQWVNSADFRARATQQASAALGVPVELGGLAVDVWPLPAVAADKVLIRSQPPLTLERIEARPTWAALLHGRMEIATLRVVNAVVPQDAVTGIAAAFQKAHPPKKNPAPSPTPEGASMVLLPRHIVLEKVTWVPSQGAAHSVIDADARLDDDGLPGSAEIEVKQGRLEGTKADVERQADGWVLRAKLGGGSVNGKFQWQPATAAKGVSVLQGVFDTANVEVSALTAPSRTLTGKLEAHTTLRGEARDVGALVEAMRSETKFTVRNAVVHGIDLAKAVKTVGMNRGGETRLDTLAGNVSTQGKAVKLNNLVATSGALSANGNVAMAPDKKLSGTVQVTLVSAAAGGALGVPLIVGGTMDEPSVTLSKGALLGAALGTAVAPGLGTGAGASLGGKIGEGLKGLFGK
jgi:uncharacterized protein involved in outer membrane biogenesis